MNGKNINGRREARVVGRHAAAQLSERRQSLLETRTSETLATLAVPHLQFPDHWPGGGGGGGAM